VIMIPDDERWDDYHKKTHNPEEPHSLYAEEKEKLFPRGCLVVELGGGTGSDSLYFLKQGHSVVILDISDFALKTATERAAKENLGQRLATRQVDFGLHQIPIKESSVEIVYSRISLHYFGSKHTTKLFSEIYKMLKPGGTAYLTFKSPEDVEEMDYLRNVGVEYEENVFIENGQLRSRFSINQLTNMLTNARIPSFEVKPQKETLRDYTGYESTLLVNEVIINKSPVVGVQTS